MGASRNAGDRGIRITHRGSHAIGEYAGLRLHLVRGRGKALNPTAESSELERVSGSQRSIGKASNSKLDNGGLQILARGRRQSMNSRRRNSTSTGGFSPPHSFCSSSLLRLTSQQSPSREGGAGRRWRKYVGSDHRLTTLALISWVWISRRREIFCGF